MGLIETIEEELEEGRPAWERSTLNLETLGRLRGGNEAFCVCFSGGNLVGKLVGNVAGVEASLCTEEVYKTCPFGPRL